MTDRSPIVRALALADGDIAAEDLDWLRRGFALALSGGASLDVALGLPDTPARRQRALRDYWIAEAAKHLTEELPWPRAEEVARAGRVFSSRVWPRWSRHDAPPESASQLEIALFKMHKCGASVPTARHVHDLIAKVTEENDEDISVEGAA